MEEKIAQVLEDCRYEGQSKKWKTTNIVSHIVSRALELSGFHVMFSRHYRDRKEPAVDLLLDWCENYLITMCPNNELFEFYSDCLVPDDYDGCHSDHGQICRTIATKAMVARLKSDKFLSEDYA